MSTWNDWAAMVLAAIGAPRTQNNLDVLNIWTQGEKPAGQPLQWNNPLNTTQQYGGANNPQNSVGVQAYASPEIGAQATAQTLLNGRYNNIVANLRGNVPRGPAWSNSAGDFATWGTHSMPGALGANTPQDFQLASATGAGAGDGAVAPGLHWSGPLGLDLSPVLWLGVILVGAGLMLGGIGLLAVMVVRGAAPAAAAAAGGVASPVRVARRVGNWRARQASLPDETAAYVRPAPRRSGRAGVRASRAARRSRRQDRDTAALFARARENREAGASAARREDKARGRPPF